MTTDDRELGMDRGISRRDFLNGVGVALTERARGAGVARGVGRERCAVARVRA